MANYSILKDKLFGFSGFYQMILVFIQLCIAFIVSSLLNCTKKLNAVMMNISINGNSEDLNNMRNLFQDRCEKYLLVI